MTLKKAAVNDRDIQKRHRVSASNIVSFWREEFDCDGNAIFISYGKQKPKANFGTSKYEGYISSLAYLCNGFRGKVLGG